MSTVTRVGRELACTRCQALWDVIELPVEHIDPDLYVCPECLRPVAGQLELERKTDEHKYDPAIAAIPF